MAYLDRIASCNFWDPSGFLPLFADAHRVGWVRPALADALTGWPGVFERAEDGLRLAPGLDGMERRSAALSEVTRRLLEQGVLPRLHGELYPVGPRREQPLFLVDREAAAWLGVRAYGQHLNGFVRAADGLHLWVGRRALDKRNFPGKLDHLAAGGLPHGISLEDNLAKECWEEAGIPRELAGRARPVGALTYCRETPYGLKPDTIYCYDLELPADFRPRCTDGEVASFELMPLAEVARLVRDGEAFKLNCNLVLIDFLIRHGYLGPGREDYLALVQGLHPVLP